MPIFGDDTLGNVKEQHIGFHTCLLTLGHDPLLVVKRNNVVRRKVGHVYICQTCKAREDENVPYQFQAMDTEILVGNLHDFLVREETTVYRLQVKMMIYERVVVQHAHLPPQYGDGLENLHRFRGCIWILPCGCT